MNELTNLLSKFKDGERLYNENPMFHNIVNSLLCGSDIYQLLEHVILAFEESQNKLAECIQNRPMCITVYDEIPEIFKKELLGLNKE